MDTTTYPRAIAELVANAIDAAGETKLGVAEKSGIPRATLLRRLSGVSPFNVDELDRIAKVLDVPTITLLKPTDNGAPVSHQESA